MLRLSVSVSDPGGRAGSSSAKLAAACCSEQPGVRLGNGGRAQIDRKQLRMLESLCHARTVPGSGRIRKLFAVLECCLYTFRY